MGTQQFCFKSFKFKICFVNKIDSLCCLCHGLCCLPSPGASLKLYHTANHFAIGHC